MKKHWRSLLLGFVAILLVIDLGMGYYLFNFALGKTGYSARNADRPLTTSEKWAQTQEQTTWRQMSADGLKLQARYYPATKPTDKTVIMIHGFGDNSLTVGPYIKLLHHAGYNVLAPDARAAGRSQGRYIGYGWQDRADLKLWVQQLIRRQGPHCQIGLYGISMGAAEVMYYLGLRVPSQVRLAIADCGYASIVGELSYQLKQIFHLPSFPLIPTANLFVQTLAHYNLYAADTRQTLKHNHIPLLLIHGTKDDFVPTKNAAINYQNDHGPKKLWYVKGAAHAQSYQKQPQKYRQYVLQWLTKYFDLTK